MAYYNKAEPGSDINELHSIIGTTISSVSPELEAYYKRYFTDRSSIVALNAKYTAVFKEVESQSKALSAQIETEKDALKSDLATYDVDRVQLETDIDSFNERAKMEVSLLSRHSRQPAMLSWHVLAHSMHDDSPLMNE